jgi:hypothetical protein
MSGVRTNVEGTTAPIALVILSAAKNPRILLLPLRVLRRCLFHIRRDPNHIPEARQPIELGLR